MTPEEINNKKLAAGILGILLGGLGIHKFILGNTVSGVIMLLVTLLSCGFLAWIPGIIGLIEGIIYLSSSNESFYTDYIVNKKSWF